MVKLIKEAQKTTSEHAYDTVSFHVVNRIDEQKICCASFTRGSFSWWKERSEICFGEALRGDVR